MMTITKVKTQIQIFLKVSLHKKNSHGEVFVLENYQCPFFSFIIEEAKAKQQAFPTKAPFQHLQLFATQMFHITVLMVFYILWTIFSRASIVRHKADFPNKIWKPYEQHDSRFNLHPYCLYYREMTRYSKSWFGVHGCRKSNDQNRGIRILSNT